LVLDLQNSTQARGTAGFTEEHIGRGQDSTIVQSWTSPNQIIGGTGGGILFDRVTFDASGAALTGNQVVFGGTLDIGSSPARVQGDGLSLIDPTGDLNIATLNVFNNAGTGLEVDTKGLGTTFNLAVGGGVLNTTGGPAMFLDPLSGNINLASVTSDGSNTTGITVDELSATGGAGRSARLSIGRAPQPGRRTTNQDQQNAGKDATLPRIRRRELSRVSKHLDPP